MSYLTLYLTILFLNFSILSFPQVESTPRGLCEQYIQQSEEQFTINETEKGKKLLKKAIIVDPTYYKPHFKLGFYYHEERLYKLASRELYIAKDKYEAEYNIKSFNVWYHDVLLLLGESELQLDRYEEALEVFNKLLSLKHSNTGALERVAWIYYKLKQYDKSRRMIKECLAIDDKDGGCLNISGILYSKNREYHKAIENYNMANFLNLEVKNNNIGEAYKSLFLYDKAKSYYMQVIQSNTSFLYALTHLNLSDIYINGLNLNQAKKILNDYEVSSFGAMKQMQTSSIQDLGFIYLYLAKVNYYSGNMKEALSLLKKAQDYPQHFGSIGYTKNHYNYLIYYMLSLVTKSLVYYEEENIDQSFIKRAFNLIDKLELLIQSWWYMRKAAEISVVKLNRIEDLYIHNTEAIFDYANLSEMLRMYDVDVIFNKLKIL
ncbi:MAG: tetratricopeptide repeat protein, partial [Spirochaetota bacterium]|nr:tetratricopeptide repeat protein [Spirochaetota bacterium]